MAMSSIRVSAVADGSRKGIAVGSYAQIHQEPDWDRSECAEIAVVALAGDKAHVLMRNIRRVRADGSLIEETSAFYVFRRGYDGWKMTAISVVSTPAAP